MPLKKKYARNKKTCNVTFILPEKFQARFVTVVGEFNSWDKEATPLEHTEGGAWEVTLKLDAGRNYQYRYLIDGEQWENDTEGDGFMAHPYGGENSVVDL